MDTFGYGHGYKEVVNSRLFPYMASRQLWDSIRRSDSEIPYADPFQGVIAAEARLRVNEFAGAADVLRRAMAGRETDPIFIRLAVRIVREKPSAEWMRRFESLLLANFDRLSPADLALAMEGGFAAGRADLSWLGYTRLKVKAPDDPMLLIVPAEYGPKWFRFRSDVPGCSVSGQDMVDLKPFLALVYLRSGNLKEAERHMRKAMGAIRKSDYAWTEVYLNAVETLIQLGNYGEARRNLDGVMKAPERTPATDIRARELLNVLEKKEREKTGWL